MQGEGQEFESPRLHHCLSAIAIEEIGSHPRTTTRHVGTVSRIEPLIHVLPIARQAMDQRIAGRRTGFGRPVGRHAPRSAPHLNNWICFGRLNESSISPSSQYEMIPIRSQSATGRLVRGWRGSSYKGHGVDALAPRADEGRGRLRNAPGSREQTLIRRCPNGETRLGSCPVTPG